MTNKILKFVLVKNTLPTAKEPYNGQFVSNGTTALDAFAEKVCAGRTNIDAPTLKLILRTAFAFLAEDMAENVFRYQTGLLTFEPAIEGSLPSMDAPLTDENPLVVAVRLASDFVREIGAAVPTRDSDDAISVKIDDVLDVEAEKYSQVTGGKRFQVTGKNISVRGEGESLAVAGPDGVAHPCTVVEEDGMGQRIVAEAAADADPGKGAILLTTRGYATPDAEPMLVKKTVTVLASATPPEPRTVSVTTERCARDGSPNTLAVGSASEFIGTNLDTVETVTWRDEVGPGEITGTVGREHWQANGDGTVLTLDETVPGEIKAATSADGIIAFVFTSHGGVPGSAQQSVKHGGLVFSA